MKKILSALLIVALVGCTTVTPKDEARLAAVADIATTVVALNAGGVELNPLIAANPAIMGAKLILPELTDDEASLKAISAIWGGAAVNNLLVLLSVSNPFTFIGGIVAGLILYNK